MKLKLITILFPVLVLYLSVYSRGYDIDISQPYASGKITLHANTVGDTVMFSNGVTLALNTFNHQGPSMVEWWTAWSFLFCDTTAQTAGFKYYPENVSQEVHWMGLGSFFFTYIHSSPDTVWNFLEKYPDSLSPIDTFGISPYYVPDGTKFTGKMIMDDITPENNRGDFIIYKNYNTIIHIHSSDSRKIAVQFDSLVISGTFPNKAFESIIFTWAADSAGNGLFKNGVTEIISLNSRKKNDNKCNYTIHGNNLILTNNQQRAVRISIFSLSGRKIIPPVDLRQNGRKRISLSSGAYIISYVSFNSKQLFKVIMR
jgi:hypothetical protein